MSGVFEAPVRRRWTLLSMSRVSPMSPVSVERFVSGGVGFLADGGDSSVLHGHVAHGVQPGIPVDHASVFDYDSSPWI